MADKAVESVELLTRSPEETMEMAVHLAPWLQVQDILFLTGDLGSGKTLFVKGLAEGLHVPETESVCSPTFVLVHPYSGRLPLYHFDLYRLTRNVEIQDILFQEAVEQGVCAIEWADKLSFLGSLDRLEIHFEHVQDTHRRVTVLAYGPRSTLLLQKI